MWWHFLGYIVQVVISSGVCSWLFWKNTRLRYGHFSCVDCPSIDKFMCHLFCSSFLKDEKRDMDTFVGHIVQVLINSDVFSWLFWKNTKLRYGHFSSVDCLCTDKFWSRLYIIFKWWKVRYGHFCWVHCPSTDKFRCLFLDYFVRI